MKEHQEAIDKWFKENQWQYWHPLSQFARLAEEVGEVGRCVNDLFGEKPKKDNEEKQELEEEIGDVFYTLICLANSQGIDLDKSIRASCSKVMKRDKNRY